MNSQHSPDLWNIMRSKKLLHIECGIESKNAGKLICSMPLSEFKNAKLISAAPELLAALKNILECGRKDLSNPKYDGYFETAKNVIQKAEA